MKQYKINAKVRILIDKQLRLYLEMPRKLRETLILEKGIQPNTIFDTIEVIEVA